MKKRPLKAQLEEKLVIIAQLEKELEYYYELGLPESGVKPGEKGRLLALEEGLIAAQAKMDELKRELWDTQANKTTLRDRLREQVEAHAALNKKLVEAQKKILELQGSPDSAKSRENRQETENSYQVRSRKLLEEKLSRLKKQLRSCMSSIDVDNASIESKKAEIANLSETCSLLESKLSSQAVALHQAQTRLKAYTETCSLYLASQPLVRLARLVRKSEGGD